MPGAFMCVRRVCERAGQETHERKCPACRFRTQEFDPEKSAQLVRGLAQTPAPPPKELMVVTTNDVPGYRIDDVHGDVFGLIVRARNYFSNVGAQLRTVSGGEVGGYTKLLRESRVEARGRMIEEARAVGANAVVAMRFDCNAIGDIMTEIAAYGTAVTITKRDALIAAGVDS